MNLTEAKQILNMHGFILDEAYTSARVKEDIRKGLIALESEISKYAYKIYLSDKRYSHTRREWDANPYDHYCPVSVYKYPRYDIHNKAEFDKWINDDDYNISNKQIIFEKIEKNYVGYSHGVTLYMTNENENSNEYVDEEGIEFKWAESIPGKYKLNWQFGDVDDFIDWLRNKFNEWKTNDIKDKMQSRSWEAERNKKNAEEEQARNRKRETKAKLHENIKRILNVNTNDLTDKKIDNIINTIYTNNTTLQGFCDVFDYIRDEEFEQRVLDSNDLMYDEDGNLPYWVDVDPAQDFGYNIVDLLTISDDFITDIYMGYFDVNENELPDLDEYSDVKSKIKAVIKFINAYDNKSTLYDTLVSLWEYAFDNDDNFNDLVDYEVNRINDSIENYDDRY